MGLNPRLTVVKEYGSEGEYFDKGNVPEVSDCESGLDQVGHSVTEPEVGGREEAGEYQLSVLPIGSFAR